MPAFFTVIVRVHFFPPPLPGFPEQVRYIFHICMGTFLLTFPPYKCYLFTFQITLPLQIAWRCSLAHHKSALKRIKQNEKRTERNKHVRSTLRTFIKRVREAVAAKDQAKAKECLAAAVPYIDSAASKGVIHRSNASRNVSRLSKLVSALG